VAAASWIKYSYLAFASQPAADRQLFRLVKRHRVARIVEVGIRDVSRTASLLEVAERYAEHKKVAYTGLDRFDDRPSDHGVLTLKQAHQAFCATGAKVRLVPGVVAASLAAVANACTNSDLLLIAPWISDSDLQSAWFYLPRMLRENSHVFRAQQAVDGKLSLVRLTAEEIAVRADQTVLAARRAVQRRAA
jgi:hypothetical protein